MLLAKNNTAGNPPRNQANVPVNQLAANASGTVSFIDQPGGTGHSDAVKMAINGMLTPPGSSWYVAWLVNTTTKQAIALGRLSLQGQNYVLDYPGNNTNLLGEGNEIEITLEHSLASAPSGTVLLSASFPVQAFVYVRHLLVSFSGTPDDTGLLVGLYGQAQMLNAVAQRLPGYAAQHNTVAIQCLAQGMLDIIEGKTGAHYRPLPATCAALHLTNAGDGYGLLSKNGYITQADAQLTLATAQPDATDDILVHRRHVGYALTDMTGWLTTLDQDTLNLFNNPQATSAIPAIVTLANHDLYGVDLNHEGSIDYVPGEAGATIAYVHGQYMAGMILAAPS
jgi:hypothetical protein